MANREYSVEEKYLAAVHYYQFHNFNKAEKDLGIPAATIKTWAKTPWWDDLMKQAIKDVDAECRTKGLEIIRLAQDALIDRLKDGDWVMNKQSKPVRKPMAARDVLFSFLTTFDKMRIINMQPTSISGSSSTIVELAKQLEQAGKTKEAKELLPQVKEDISNA